MIKIVNILWLWHHDWPTGTDRQSPASSPPLLHLFHQLLCLNGVSHKRFYWFFWRDVARKGLICSILSFNLSAFLSWRSGTCQTQSFGFQQWILRLWSRERWNSTLWCLWAAPQTSLRAWFIFCMFLTNTPRYTSYVFTLFTTMCSTILFYYWI